MRRPPRRPPNPGFREPRSYLKQGFLVPGTAELRPELGAELAAAMGRELLVQGVPLAAIGQAVQELDLVARLGQDLAAVRQRLIALSARGEYTRYPLLAQLLAAGQDAVRRPEELKAFARHLRRVYTLAAFEAALGAASVLERERARRQSKVVKHRRREY